MLMLISHIPAAEALSSYPYPHKPMEIIPPTASTKALSCVGKCKPWNVSEYGHWRERRQKDEQRKESERNPHTPTNTHTPDTSVRYLQQVVFDEQAIAGSRGVLDERRDFTVAELEADVS